MLLTLIIIVLVLILLTTAAKINPFIAFLVVSFLGGILFGMPLTQIAKSVEKGLGDILGTIVIIIVIGAMLGKLVAESGAARVIADTMMNAFGRKYLKWGMLLTGFVIGIPMFYNVAFILVVPIIFSLAYQYKLPAVYIGMPMLASLSVAHGFLPPHPSPVALVSMFHANMGQTLLFGIVVAIPTIILAGPVFSRFLRHIKPVTINETFISDSTLPEKLPGKFYSFFSALLPVFLIAFASLFLLGFPKTGAAARVLGFINEPSVIMIIALVFVTWLLGIRQGRSLKQVMKIYEGAIRDVAVILLILGGAGALKQILLDSGISNQVAALFAGSGMHPLILGWLIAATIRVCLGSATVAGITAAGIIAPMLASLHVHPSLMVLSIGAGSLMFSHVNDIGFWMYKEFFGTSLRDTILSWSLMETIVSVTGLIAVLILNQFL